MFCKVSKLHFQKLLGNRIKAVRENKNVSQQELASECDFEKSNMSRIEAGKTNPTYYTLVKIAKALKVNLAELMDIL